MPSENQTPAPATLDYAQSPAPSKAALWTGRVLSALPVLIMGMSGVTKLIPPTKEIAEGFELLGWPLRYAHPLAAVELGCVLLFIIPRTAVLGAILVTGYMGGAIATHVRVGDNFMLQAALPILAWLGLFLRDPRLRALLPVRTRP